MADTASGTDQAEERDVRVATTSWLNYLAYKAGGAAISIILVIISGFFIFRVLPGDPVRSLTAGKRVSAEQLEVLRHEFGLDRPLPAQFVHYLTDLVTGNLGFSYTYNEPVVHLIAERIGPTLLLTGTSAGLAVIIGLWLGQKSAWKRNGAFDKSQTAIALVFWSVPTFWLGLLLVLLFGGVLQVLPTGGMETPGTHQTGFSHVLDVAQHLILPVVALLAVTYAHYLMVMRASLLEEMTSEYLTTARAKGLREDQVRRRHAVPNALLPTVTIIFLTLGTLIGGAVTVETVFSWPGLGYLTYKALTEPDYPVLQGTFVVFSTIVIVTNFLAEIVYRILDPRLR